MAITVTGFDGTVDEVQAAIREKYAGVNYAFGGEADFKPTLAAGADRTLSFASGEAWGQHVLVKSDAPITAQSGSVVSGSRYDTFVLRRNWSGAGGTASIIVVQGTSARTVSGSVLTNPGVQDDQVICLGRVTAGQTAIQEIVDLRTHASKVITAPDLMAIKNPSHGMVAEVGSARYKYLLDGSNNPAWIRQDSISAAAGIVTATPAWFTTAFQFAQRVNGMICLRLRFTYTGAPVTASGETAAEPGGLTDLEVCTIAPAWRPTLGGGFNWTFHGQIGGVSGGVRLDPNTGKFMLSDMPTGGKLVSGEIVQFDIVFPGVV